MSASSSNGTKSGFFGYIKGPFRRGDESNHTASGEDTSYMTEVAPLVPPPVEVAPAAPVTAPVARVAAAPAPAANPNVDTLGAGVTPGIAVPLQAIIAGLPPELRDRVRVQTIGDLSINVAIAIIVYSITALGIPIILFIVVNR